MVGDSRDGERVVPWEGEIRRSRGRLGSRGPEGGVLGSKQGCAVSVSFNYSLQGLPCMPLILERSQGNVERRTDQSPLRSSITLREPEITWSWLPTSAPIFGHSPSISLTDSLFSCPLNAGNPKSLALDHLLT